MSTLSSSNDLYICGYPRSGNSFLAQLLGDALDSPVTGLGSANPIASEGKDRPGPYVVRQLHLKARRGLGQGRALASAYEFDLDHYAGERIVHIHRDPRDVAVSAWKFFDYPSLEATLHSMAGKAPGALGVHGLWTEFVRSWLQTAMLGLVHVRYEALLDVPAYWLMEILKAWGIQPINDVEDVVTRQSFAAKRAQIERDGNTRPYGKALQLKHLRRGKSGDWRNWFGEREAELAQLYFGDLMQRLGYESN